MKASTLLTPCACCSGPRAVSTIALRARPEHARGFDELRLRNAGERFDALRPVCSREPPHVVEPFGAVCRCSRDRSATSRISRCSSRWRAPHPSPGATRRWSVAHWAVGVRRGSTTISAPPLRCCASKYCMIGGIVSARLPPTSRIASACGMSSSGNGSPRSMPSALDRCRGRRRHAEAAVVVDVRRAQRDARELAEQIRLLVGQRPAAEHADGIAAVSRLCRAGSPTRFDRSRSPRSPARACRSALRTSGDSSRSGCRASRRPSIP